MGTIHSMTGFGKGEFSNSTYQLTLEIKSVNNRYQDIRVRMPSVFSSLELLLKKKIRGSFSRGSFEVSVNLKRAEDNSKLADLDHNKIESFISEIKKLASKSQVPMTIDPTQFLRNEFYLDVDLSKDMDLINGLWSAMDNAIKSLSNSRLEEGKKMTVVIEKHVAEYAKFLKIIESHTELFQKNTEERIRRRFKEFKEDIEIDEPRFMQEVIYYLEKLDVHEELNRMKSHLEGFNKMLSDGGEVGRKIDFLIQELNRETNTIGSKSNVKEISDSVVQMKLQLEKIREQGLNLE